MDRHMASKQAVNACEEMDLGGGNIIAGVFIQSSKEKMSIYQAMMRCILTQGTALVLLEAQAATGFIIDPVKNKKVPVRDALGAGLTGAHYYGKLLSAEKAVTGYTDPCTGNKISLFQAMKKDLIIKDHGIRLLQAQIATGGIIDPVHSHRVPVEVAYKQGYFDEEMNAILSDPQKHSRSCFDPNTHENLTYMQLLSRCVPDPDTGLLMLQLMHKGSVLFQLDEQTRISLQSAPASVSVGLFQGQNVTVWELLFSRYIPEHERRELLKKYKAGTLTIQEMTTIITTIITETEEKSSRELRPLTSPSRQRATSQKAEAALSQRDEKWEKALKSTMVDGPGGEFQGHRVSVWELLFSKYVPEEKRQELLKKYEAGTLTVQEMITILTATVTEAEERSSKPPACRRTPSKEPVASEKAKDALSRERQELEKTLKSTLVEVPAGEFQGRKVSVWDLLLSKYIPEEKRKELLELYRAGILTTDQMKTIVTGIVTKTEEESHRRLSHGESPGMQETATSEKAETLHSPHNNHLENALCAEAVSIPVGEFKGQEVSVWELLFSSYISETKRQELLKKYRVGTLTIREMITIITTIVTETETRSSNPETNTTDPSKGLVTSDGGKDPCSCEQHLRKSLKSVTIYVTGGELQGQKVSLLDLLFSQYIPQEKRQKLLELYRTGIITTEQMIPIITRIIEKTEAASRKLMESVKSRKRETITSEEAVAAHSPQDVQVDNILKSTTIDGPLSDFQGQKASVWDLLLSKYIPEEKQQDILELYREGILTLDQVITVVTTIVEKKAATSRKFVIKVKTPSKDVMTSEQAEAIHLPEDHQLEKTLKSTVVDVPVGEFHAEKASVWDLLFSKYIPEEKQQEILKLYREGILTLDQVITVVTTIVEKKAATSRKFVINVKTPSKDIMTPEQAVAIHLPEDHQLEKTLKSTVVDVPVGEFHAEKASVWDLLFSKYIPEEKQQEILKLYREGILTLDQVITVVTTIVEKKAATSRKFVINVKTPSKDIMTSEQAEAIHLPEDHQLEKTLKSTVVDVPVGEFHAEKASVWDLLFSKYIPEEKQQEILKLYREGILTLDQVITVVTTIVEKKAATSRKFVINVKTPSKDIMTPEQAEAIHLPEDHQLEKTLKSTVVDVPVGEFHAEKASVWDLLFSKYIPEEKQQEILKLYREGILTLDQVITVVTTIVEKKAATSRKFVINVKTPSKDIMTSEQAEAIHLPEDHQLEKTLKSTVVDVPVGEFHAEKASVWDLLFSKYIPEENQQEILKLYREGILTLDQVITVVTTIVEKKAATSRKFVINVKTPSKDVMTSEQAEAIHLPEDHQLEKTLKSTMVDVPVGEFHAEKASVWDLLFSKYIPEEKQQEILKLYREGILTLNQVITVVTTIVEKKAATSRKFVINVKTPSKDIMTSEQAVAIHLPEDHQLEKTLKSTVVDVPVGEFHAEKALVWDLLFSKYIPEEKRQEILELYREGILTLDQVITVVTTTVEKKEATSRNPLAGRFHAQKASIWDLLFSKYISKETKKELLKRYRAGTLATDKLKAILTTIIVCALEECLTPNNEQILHLLQSETSYVTVGQFRDQRVSVRELLSSKCISQYNREAHLNTYNTGGLTVNEITITTTIITGSEGKKEDCQ